MRLPCSKGVCLRRIRIYSDTKDAHTSVGEITMSNKDSECELQLQNSQTRVKKTQNLASFDTKLAIGI